MKSCAENLQRLHKLERLAIGLRTWDKYWGNYIVYSLYIRVRLLRQIIVNFGPNMKQIRANDIIIFLKVGPEWIVE